MNLLAAESLYDPLKHLPILLQRVRIESGHHATAAQIVNTDDHVADAQALTRPCALSQTVHFADNNIGPEPPSVMTEGRDGTSGAIRRGRMSNRAGLSSRVRCAPTISTTSCETFGSVHSNPSTIGSPEELSFA